MAEKLKIISLGGLNEIGKNITVLEYGKDIIIVDCGLGFPEDDMYGVDLVIADMTYLVKNKQKIRGLFLTHGHVFGAGMHNSVDHAPALPEGSSLVYGHTHIKVNEESAAHLGLWLFNPGSVSIPKDGTHSYGIYEGGTFRHVVMEEE